MRLELGALKIELDEGDDVEAFFRGLFRHFNNMELSEMLGVSPKTVTRWKRDGRLPGGSGNSMARELGLPKDPAAAARALAGPHTLSFRPGKVDGRHFLLMAGFGFDGLAIHLISKSMKNRLGLLGYILTGFRCLVHRHPSMGVETPDGKRRGVWVVAARGQH